MNPAVHYLMAMGASVGCAISVGAASQSFAWGCAAFSACAVLYVLSLRTG